MAAKRVSTTSCSSAGIIIGWCTRGGFSCERDAERTVIFRDEFGEIIPEMGYRPLPHRDIVIDLKKQLQDRFIHSKTCVTRWDGETMDRHLAVGLLCDLDDKQTLTDSHTV